MINIDKEFLYKICYVLQLDIDGDVFVIQNQVTGKSANVYINANDGVIKIVE